MTDEAPPVEADDESDAPEQDQAPAVEVDDDGEVEDSRPLVLCVQADRGNLTTIERVLETTGRYRLASATDGVSALDLAEKRLPSLILLGLDLPFVDGFECQRRLRAGSATAQIPVVAVTASVMKGERRRCLAAGFAGFVEKPFDIHDLRRLVAQLVSRASSSSGAAAAMDGKAPPPEANEET